MPIEPSNSFSFSLFLLFFTLFHLFTINCRPSHYQRPQSSLGSSWRQAHCLCSSMSWRTVYTWLTPKIKLNCTTKRRENNMLLFMYSKLCYIASATPSVFHIVFQARSRLAQRRLCGYLEETLSVSVTKGCGTLKGLSKVP